MATTKTCSAPNCTNKFRARGLCSGHYNRMHQSGFCAIEGCDKVIKARGWCAAHWERWSKYSDPLGYKLRATPAEVRFWAMVDKNGVGGCWLWTAHLSKGYGLLRLNGRKGPTVSAHRFAYELLVGPIPEGLDLDHLCRVRACVYPDHLEPVTRSVNLRRGIGPALMSKRNRGRHKTHCMRGHPYDLFNTAINSRGARSCRACRTAYDKRRDRRK